MGFWAQIWWNLKRVINNYLICRVLDSIASDTRFNFSLGNYLCCLDEFTSVFYARCATETAVDYSLWANHTSLSSFWTVLILCKMVYIAKIFTVILRWKYFVVDFNWVNYIFPLIGNDDLRWNLWRIISSRNMRTSIAISTWESHRVIDYHSWQWRQSSWKFSASTLFGCTWSLFLDAGVQCEIICDLCLKFCRSSLGYLCLGCHCLLSTSAALVLGVSACSEDRKLFHRWLRPLLSCRLLGWSKLFIGTFPIAYWRIVPIVGHAFGPCVLLDSGEVSVFSQLLWQQHPAVPFYDGHARPIERSTGYIGSSARLKEWSLSCTSTSAMESTYWFQFGKLGHWHWFLNVTLNFHTGIFFHKLWVVCSPNFFNSFGFINFDF